VKFGIHPRSSRGSEIFLLTKVDVVDANSSRYVGAAGLEPMNNMGIIWAKSPCVPTSPKLGLFHDPALSPPEAEEGKGEGA